MTFNLQYESLSEENEREDHQFHRKHVNVQISLLMGLNSKCGFFEICFHWWSKSKEHLAILSPKC